MLLHFMCVYISKALFFSQIPVCNFRGSLYFQYTLSFLFKEIYSLMLNKLLHFPIRYNALKWWGIAFELYSLIGFKSLPEICSIASHLQGVVIGPRKAPWGPVKTVPKCPSLVVKPGSILRFTLQTESMCYSVYGTIKIPPCLKVDLKLLT